MNQQEKIGRLIQSIEAAASISQLEIQCNGLDLDQVDKHGSTPLMVAARGGWYAAVETLVRNGASVRASGLKQMTPLHEAAANGEVAIASYLLSHGALIDAETVEGVTPLMCAAAWGNTEVVELLLKNGANPKKTADRGDTAADIAREKGHDKAAQLIDSHPQP